MPRRPSRRTIGRGTFVANVVQDPDIACWAPRVMRHRSDDGAVAYAFRDV